MNYEMTDEIAFELGKFNFPRFYSFVLWKVNREQFPLFRFFDWTMSGMIPLDKEGKNINWENIPLWGKLKTKEIKTISQKLAYVKGSIGGYKRTNDTEITICYANSYDLRDFLAECLRDVLMDKYVWSGAAFKTFGPNNKLNPPFWRISKEETLGTCPGTPSVTLTGDKEVIDYICNV